MSAMKQFGWSSYGIRRECAKNAPLVLNVRGQAGRGKRVQHATKRRSRPCLHRACSARKSTCWPLLLNRHLKGAGLYEFRRQKAAVPSEPVSESATMASHHWPGKQLAADMDALAALPGSHIGLCAKCGSTLGAQPLPASLSPAHLSRITPAKHDQGTEQPEPADKPNNVDNR